MSGLILIFTNLKPSSADMRTDKSAACRGSEPATSRRLKPLHATLVIRRDAEAEKQCSVRQVTSFLAAEIDADEDLPLHPRGQCPKATWWLVRG